MSADQDASDAEEIIFRHLAAMLRAMFEPIVKPHRKISPGAITCFADRMSAFKVVLLSIACHLHDHEYSSTGCYVEAMDERLDTVLHATLDLFLERSGGAGAGQYQRQP